MKRILIFSTAYFPFVGGAEIAVKEITDRANGFEFDLITAKMDKALKPVEQIGRVRVYRVGWGAKTIDKLLLPFLGYHQAVKLQKIQSYDLIWSIMASQASIAASFFKNKYKRIKLLLTLQEGDEEEHLKRYVLNIDWLYRLLIRPWHLSVFKRADHLSVISNYLKDRAVKNGVKIPIEIIPNAVDINRFSRVYSSDELNKIRNRLEKRTGDIYLITTSRLVQKNAVGDVIRSLPLLPDRVKFAILGIGPEENKLKKIASELKLNDRVNFLGQVDQQDIAKYLKAADIFIRPSLSEGLGNSFLEAMAAGLPVIGTPVGGIPDFLIDGETGLFCRVRDPKSIAEKVELILGNEALRNKIIFNARKIAEGNYDWPLITQKMVNIFDKLTN